MQVLIKKNSQAKQIFKNIYLKNIITAFIKKQSDSFVFTNIYSIKTECLINQVFIKNTFLMMIINYRIKKIYKISFNETHRPRLYLFTF